MQNVKCRIGGKKWELRRLKNPPESPFYKGGNLPFDYAQGDWLCGFATLREIIIFDVGCGYGFRVKHGMTIRIWE